MTLNYAHREVVVSIGKRLQLTSAMLSLYRVACAKGLRQRAVWPIPLRH